MVVFKLIRFDFILYRIGGDCNSCFKFWFMFFFSFFNVCVVDEYVINDFGNVSVLYLEFLWFFGDFFIFLFNL